jgi:hypothetical protein
MDRRNRIVPGVLLILLGVWALLESLGVDWLRMDAFWRSSSSSLACWASTAACAASRVTPAESGSACSLCWPAGCSCYVTVGPGEWEEMAQSGRCSAHRGIAWGVAWLVDIKQVSNFVAGVVALLVGIGGLLYTAGRLAPAWGAALVTYWPLILVALGLGFIAQYWLRRS